MKYMIVAEAILEATIPNKEDLLAYGQAFEAWGSMPDEFNKLSNLVENLRDSFFHSGSDKDIEQVNKNRLRLIKYLQKKQPKRGEEIGRLK